MLTTEVICFLCISIFIPADGANAGGTTDKEIDLSDNTKKLIDEKYSKENVRIDMKKKELEIKKLNISIQESDKEKKYIVSTQLPLMFECAVSIAKADIDAAQIHYHIFQAIKIPSPSSTSSTRVGEITQKKMTKMPYTFPMNIENLVKLENPSRQHFYQIRFNNFFLRLKGQDQSSFFNALRTNIKSEYKEDLERLEEVYFQFSATIVRDYSFFSKMHHVEMAKLVNKIGYEPKRRYMNVLFDAHPAFFLNATHIKNLNIFRKSFHGESYHGDIIGFKTTNWINQEVEIPTLQYCGADDRFYTVSTPKSINTAEY